MRFEAPQAPEILGPLLTEQALSEFPIFASDKPDIEDTIEAALKSDSSDLVEHLDRYGPSPIDGFSQTTTIASELRSLRAFTKDERRASDGTVLTQLPTPGAKLSEPATGGMLLSSNGLGSCREIHESLLTILVETNRLSQEAQCVVDHSMLFRAKEKYLFDAVVNRNVVADDPWVKFVWDWIAGSLFTIRLIIPVN